MINFFYETKSNPIHYFNSTSLTDLPHLHQELELVIVFSGEATAFCDNKSYDLNPGDLFLSFPNQIHFYNVKKRGSYGVCIFSPNVIYEQGSTLLKKYPLNNKVTLLTPTDNNTAALLDSANGEYRNMLLCGCLNILLGDLLPAFELTDRKASNNSSIVKQFINYCSDHYTEELTLDDIAKNLGISKYYLSHLISDSLKIHLSDYINSIRVNASIIMLEKPENKIADISENIGYGTIRSFNRAFKQIMKLTPTQYRKIIAGKYSSGK